MDIDRSIDGSAGADVVHGVDDVDGNVCED